MSYRILDMEADKCISHGGAADIEAGVVCEHRI